ncbi:MAG: MCE family protein [Paraprevotella sp.]|nr:MCE family protein [Paraprevotella sp.]
MKYFTKEVKIGLTGVVALVVLFIGINFLKGINLFKASNTYYIEFADIKGLAKSSPVFSNGFRIGTVNDIIYNYQDPGKLLIQISVNENMRIPKGSTARLDVAVLGGCDLHLDLSKNTEFHQVGDTIKGDDKKGLMDKAGDMVPQMEQIIGKVDTLLTTLNALIANPNLTGILNDAKGITANLNETSVQLNDLMKNDLPQLTDKLNTVGSNVVTLTNNLNQIDIQAAMSKVDTTLNYIQLMSEKMNRKDNSLGLLLNDSSLYNNLSQTAGSANNLLIDLKENPKRYVHFSLFGKK